MVVLQTIGNYEIISEKEDKCEPNWADYIIIFTITGAIIITCVSIWISLYYFNLNSSYHSDIMGFAVVFGGLVLSFFFFVISIGIYAQYYVKYGVKISLKKLDKSWGEKGDILSSKMYQFTNDNLKDVENVKKITKEFVNKANLLVLENANSNKVREQCRNRYNSIMQEVKLE